jgi:predicted short-subunit dehydrogenase-like oxidoreductase (DUF2520 family)
MRPRSARRARRPAVTVVGAGRLARALLPALERAGYPVAAVAARRPAAARAACRGLRRAVPTTSLARAVEPASLILLAVSDPALAELARRLAALPGIDWKRRTVLHHAGARGPEPLAPLARAGAAVGLFHPLQCLGSPRAAGQLAGSRVRIEGDARARAVGSRLARDLDLTVLPLRRAPSRADRIAYHAAAAMLSNDVVGLLGLGVEVLRAAGAEAAAARHALLALARGTLAQVEQAGVAAALTGPVARGDVATLREHLDCLGRLSPLARDVHRLLSAALVRLARETGRAPAGAAALERLVSPPARRRNRGVGRAPRSAV